MQTRKDAVRVMALWLALAGACGGGSHANFDGNVAPSSDSASVIDASVVDTSMVDSSVSDSSVMIDPGMCGAIPKEGAWDPKTVSPVTPPAGEPSYEWTGKPMAVVVDPFVASTVWLGTGSDGLYKSTTCGAPGSWVKVDTGANHDVLESGNLWSMAVDPDPSRQGVIYVLVSYGSNNGIWKSTNAGVDFTQLLIGSNSALASDFWSNLSMDASNTLHIAVTTHGKTTVAGYENGAIAESFDGGKTWPNIVEMPAAWGEGGGLYLVPTTTSGTTSTWIWGTGDAQPAAS